jgi:hypothetical protein
MKSTKKGHCGVLKPDLELDEGGGRPRLDYKIEQHFGDQTEVEFDGWGNGTPASLA